VETFAFEGEISHARDERGALWERVRHWSSTVASLRALFRGRVDSRENSVVLDVDARVRRARVVKRDAR